MTSMRVAVIGAGFSGLSVGVGLRREGIEDFAILERAADVGGTWRDNTYPGVACDVPSKLYSMTFAPNQEWSRGYSSGAEIWDYQRRIVDEQGLRPHLHLGEEVLDARWDDAGARWRLTTASGGREAEVLIDCAGPLTEPNVPAVPGLEDFEGTIFHSNRWRHDHDLTGRRVAVVGTGASAIQFIPAVQRSAAHLVLFQRTAPWVLPKADRPISRTERRVLAAFPQITRAGYRAQWWVRDVLGHPIIRRSGAARATMEGLARAYLRLAVHDPELRRLLTPDYEIGCKRILFSNEYYGAVTQPNVELVAGGMRAAGAHQVVGPDGREHEVDTIIFGTGFDVTAPPIIHRIHGRGGRTLAQAWHADPETQKARPSYYKATEVAGFPNYFRLCGPGTGLGTGSMTCQIESQLGYVLAAVRRMRREGLAAVEVRPDAQAAYMERLGRDLEQTVWSLGGCDSWYLDDGKRPTVMWPHTMAEFRRMLRDFDLSDHEVRRAAEAPVPA